MPISSFLSPSAPGRSSRPRPNSSTGIIALVGGTGHLCPRFSLSPPGNWGGNIRGGLGRRIGGENISEAGSKEDINPIGAERNHSNGKNNGETEENILARMDNKLAPMDHTLSQVENTQTVMTNILARTASTSPTNSSDVNKIKGLLNFIDTFTWIVFMYHISLFSFSVTFPGSQWALVSYEDTWTKVICFINLESCILGGPLVLSFAAHFKGSKSIEHIGFDVFIWALFLWWLAYIIECGITLHVYVQIPNTVVWPVEFAVFCLTSLPSVVYIEYQRPTIMSKWAKNMWKKITGFSERCQCLPWP